MKSLLFTLAMYLAVLCVPFLLAGCPTPPPANEPPVANAGPNQTVNGGDVVTLNGTGSSDPDGDCLTYLWEQLPDTVVVALNVANSPTPAFIAPDATLTLTFRLTVSDGTLSATDTVEVVVNPTVTTMPALFVANFGSDSITAYDISSANNVNGNVAPSASLAGGQTQLSGPSGMAIGTDGSLLVSNAVTPSIKTYLNARDLTGIDGDIAPARNVQGAATTLNAPGSMAFRASNDLLFVSDVSPARILVFADASTPSFNGDVAPIRTFTSTDANNPIAMSFGAGDTLYVANFGIARSIAVFDNASSLNGAVAATRVITSTSFGNLFDVFVDAANNRMFVMDSGNVSIHVFENASTLSGDLVPDSSLTVAGGVNLTAVAVDSNGTGYIVDRESNAVYSYDNIATRNGTFAPDRTLSGANTQLNEPYSVFLLEE